MAPRTDVMPIEPSPDSRAIRGHARLIVAVVAFAIASFGASTLYVDSRLRGIEAESAAVAEGAAPSILNLSAMRVDLRDLDMAVGDELQARDGAAERADTAMRGAGTNLVEYLRTPLSADREARGASLGGTYDRMYEALRTVRARAADGDRSGARMTYEDTLRPYIRQLDDTAATVLEWSARDARAGAMEIEAHRRAAQRVSVALDAACLLASLAFGLLTFLLVRQDERGLLRKRGTSIAPLAVHGR
jgi:hypothetical protein